METSYAVLDWIFFPALPAGTLELVDHRIWLDLTAAHASPSPAAMSAK